MSEAGKLSSPGHVGSWFATNAGAGALIPHPRVTPAPPTPLGAE